MVQPRIPPQDIETERALLGSVMLNPQGIYDAADVVSPESFYASKHAIIFDSMLALHSKGEPIDLVTLSAKLKERKQLEKIGGSTYLSDLVNAATNPGSVRHYAEIVQAKGILRNLIAVGGEINELGYAEHRDVVDLLDEAQAKVFRLSNVSSLRSFTDIGTSLKESWERLERLSQSTDEMRGVPTGFTALDNKLAGFQKSDLIILAARPSMGKTSFALDVARRAAIDHKIPVGVFSLEMSAQQLTERMLAATSYVDAWKLRTGKGLTTGDYENLQQAIATLDEAPIFIDDKSTNTVLGMRSTARRMKNERGLGMIIIDYLQLIAPTTTRANDTVVQQVTEISRALKGMARELDVPVIALSQLSRAVEQLGGRPRLSDLRESGAIEQDADVVMFIHREDKDKRYQEGGFDNGHQDFKKELIDVELIIAKHRNGPVGTVHLHFKEGQTRFETVSKDDFGNDISQETQVEF
jgi:replicative DNA helicase